MNAIIYNEFSEVEMRPLPVSYISAEHNPLKILFAFDNVTVSLSTGDILHIRADGIDYIGLVEGYVTNWGWPFPNLMWITGNSPLFTFGSITYEDFFGSGRTHQYQSKTESVIILTRIGQSTYDHRATLISFNGLEINSL